MSDSGFSAQYLKAADVSQMMNVPLGTIYSWVHRGEIPYVRLGRRALRFPTLELHNWIEARRCQPGRPEAPAEA